MKVLSTLKTLTGRLNTWGTGLLSWLDSKSSLIIAIAAVIALFIYYSQTGIMEDSLEVTRHQQNTTDSTLKLLKRQTDILAEESVRRFRPFPIINVTNIGRAFLTYGILLPDGKIETKDVSLVAHGSLEWNNRVAVALAVNNVTFQIKNKGSSPLYVTGRDVGGITHTEWFEVYNKSDKEICRMALEKEAFWYPEIDVLVMPNDSIKVPASQAIAVRTMNIKKFDTYLTQESGGLPYYVYLYLQYKDLYGRTYDALWMTTYRFDFKRIKNDEGEYLDSVKLKAPFREKMSWDILFPSDSNSQP